MSKTTLLSAALLLAVSGSLLSNEHMAEVYQVNGNRPGMATAEIYQTGASNVVTLEQHEYRDELSVTATIRQEGTGNRLDAMQTWVGNEINVVSIGQRNTVEVDQSGFSTAQVRQTGTTNLVRLEQISTGIGGGFAVVDQTGTANQADIYQYSGRYPAGDVFLTQVGDANSAAIKSGSSYSTLDYKQQGIGNQLDAGITGQNSSLTGYSQGNYNSVVTSQAGNNNSLDIAQLGSDNQIDAYQDLYAHQAAISQIGNANQVLLRQSQSLEGNTASIVQNGNGNVASVFQN